MVSENAKLFSEKVEAEVQARFEVQRETLAQELKAQALEWGATSNAVGMAGSSGGRIPSSSSMKNCARVMRP